MCGELSTFAVLFLSLWRESINERVKTQSHTQWWGTTMLSILRLLYVLAKSRPTHPLMAKHT